MKVQENTKLPKPLKIIFIIGLTLLSLLFILPSIFIFMYIFFFRPFQIAGNAMYPNYINGQYYLSSVQKSPIGRGDVIVFIAPDDPEKDYIKRVIAISGDTLMIGGGQVYLNDKPLTESSYLDGSMQTYTGNFFKEYQRVTVPDGYYFVLGDNRPYSNDSRQWGLLPKQNIVGKMLFCYWNCKSSH